MNRVKAVFFVVASLFVTSGLVFTGFRVYRGFLAEKMLDAKYRIDTIVQTGPEKEAVSSLYLAELLGLSSDQPQNAFTFDLKEASAKLCCSPVIKRAKVKVVKPNTVYIDYEVYKPVAKWADKSNLAIDETGHVFPLLPFFSPKRLPEIYFGSEEICKERFEVALAILSYLDRRESFRDSTIQLIDVSLADHESFGKREVVVTLEERGKLWYLRLTPHKFPEELNYYVTLREGVKTTSCTKKVVDLRLAKVAYIEEIL